MDFSSGSNGAVDPFAVPPLVAPEPGGELGAVNAATAPAADAEAESSGVPAGVGTPTAVLAAARKLFAQHGYNGASVRAITAAAEANLGAITYHFGSKKALYNRVVEECVSPLVTRVEAALARRGPMLDRLEGVVRAYFEHVAENPDLPHLMLQEVVLSGAPPEAAAPFMRRIYGLIVAAIREGQASGEVRAGDPVLLGVSLISQPIFPMLVRQPIEAMTGLSLLDPHTRERVEANVIAFARAGFAGPNGASGVGEAKGSLQATGADAAAGAIPNAAVSAEEAP